MFSCPTRATREVTEGTTSRPLRVVFVCLGNICRSPIAERVAEHAAAEAGITGVEFASAGTISEKYDDPMDHRAVAVLKERGYRYADHKARRITEARIESADLVVAMEDVHLRSVLKLAPDPSRVCLLTEFDPAAVPGSGVPDPWFGSDAGFYETALRVIGRYMDEQKPRDVFFFEQDGAFVVRLLRSTQAGHHHELSEFTRDDITEMVARGPTLRQPDMPKPDAGSSTGTGTSTQEVRS